MRSNIRPRPYWSSMTSYLLVTTGAVVGLGNLVRFPFYVYKFGGLFVVFYLLCTSLFSLPILLVDLLIGRRGKQNPVGSFSILSMETGASRAWRLIGWLCFAILFLSLADYTVSVAFPVSYFSNIFSTIAMKGLHHPVPQITSSITDNIMLLEICLVTFLFITMLVILRGINRGLEAISRITVPAYFIILLVLAIYSCTVGNFSQAVNYLFDITPQASWSEVFFTALTYAFFTLNVGMGIMIVYGSYLPYSVPLGSSTILIVCFDALISFLAYFIIYPLFAPSMSAGQSASYQETLFFFLQTPHGNIVALFFFFAAVIAAWTPTIAMAESATITLIERFNLTRRTAALFIFASVFLLGTMIILFFHHWPIAVVAELTSYFLIPISTLLTAIFAGWILSRDITFSELGFKTAWYNIWLFLVRFVAPIAIVITIFMHFTR